MPRDHREGVRRAPVHRLTECALTDKSCWACAGSLNTLPAVASRRRIRALSHCRCWKHEEDERRNGESRGQRGEQSYRSSHNHLRAFPKNGGLPRVKPLPPFYLVSAGHQGAATL